MAKDYLNYRYKEEERKDNFAIYVHKNFNDAKNIIVDFVNNLYVETKETLVYTINHKNDFEWKPLLETLL